MNFRRVLAWALSAWIALVLGGCASVPQPTASDPLESWNRGVFRFNDALDQSVLKPTATAYQDHVPDVVRHGVGNFFNNLADAWTGVNSALQLKGEAAGTSLTRFWLNTLLGFGGLLDIATDLQIPRYNEDFGQTLGYWGVGPGPYLMLPVLGPSTVRDTSALPVDWYGDIVTYADDITTRNVLLATRIVHQRAALLKQEGLMDAATTDRYSLVRDVYLQYRRNQVYDGDPPDEPSDEDPDPGTDAPGQPAAGAKR